MRVFFVQLLLVAAVSAPAQPVVSFERFEFVAIRSIEAEPDVQVCSGGPGTSDPELLRCEMSLAKFVSLSYDLGPLQFVPPDWMTYSWWDIEGENCAGSHRRAR